MSNDPWKHRSQNMACKTCMWFAPKVVANSPSYDLGRCRRHAPTMNGYPVVMVNDWCGDHKLDETKLIQETSEPLKSYFEKAKIRQPVCGCDKPKRSLPEDAECERCHKPIGVPPRNKVCPNCTQPIGYSVNKYDDTDYCHCMVNDQDNPRY